MSAARQLDNLITSWTARHGPLVYRGRRTKLVELVNLHFNDGTGARLSRDQGEEFWVVVKDPDDSNTSPELMPPDTMERRGGDPEWRRWINRNG